MPRPSTVALAAVLAGALAVAVAPDAAGAQGWLDKAKQRAKEKVERRIDERTGQAIDKGIDAGESAVKCAATDRACIDGARAADKTVETTDAGDGGAAASPAADGRAGAAAAPRVNTGRDFTPGTRVLFATDFRRDEVGDFPRRFELGSGNMEVAEVGDTRYLRSTSFGHFEIPLPEVLPEQFTAEFDLKPVAGWTQYVYFTDEKEARPHLAFSTEEGGIEGPKGYRVRSGYKNPDAKHHVVRVQVMADGKYVKVYMDGVRVANAPNADVGRSNKIVFRTSADAAHPVMVGNVRIAAGGKDLYRALEETGRVIADGIFFDTNADRIRPESEPVLAQIGDMLAKHPGMRLSIEGHTDAVGQAASNQALSAKRAAAVRTYLTTKHGIDASRLEAKGLGATKPVAPNADEAGRQKNRRVELVKL